MGYSKWNTVLSFKAVTHPKYERSKPYVLMHFPVSKLKAFPTISQFTLLTKPQIHSLTHSHCRV